MCVVSMVGDHFNDKWGQPHYNRIITNYPEISKKDFDDLKKEVQEMKALLKRAKIYDIENNEPECEIEDKMKKLREIAKMVGIDLDDVLTKNT